MSSRIISHLLTTFRSHAGLMFATILVLSGSLFVSGGLLLMGQNLQKVLTLWGDSLQMSVYLKETATPEQSEQLKLRFQSDKRIGKAELIARETALATFQEQMATYAPDLLKDAQLLKFIPESFQIQLSDAVSSEAQLETLRSLADELKNDEAVEEVSFGQEWVKTYASIVRAVSSLGTWLILLLGAASLFVISNSISSSIQQRRNEIEVLELVGASKWFIRVPFLAEGLFMGLVAGVIALVLLGIGFQMLQTQFASQIALLQLSHHLAFFSVPTLLGFVAAATTLGALSAHLSLRRLNDGWSASRKQGA
jgi:cell division transport system permease protein